MAYSWAKYEHSNNTGNERWKKKRRAKEEMDGLLTFRTIGTFKVSLLTKESAIDSNRNQWLCSLLI